MYSERGHLKETRGTSVKNESSPRIVSSTHIEQHLKQIPGDRQELIQFEKNIADRVSRSITHGDIGSLIIQNTHQIIEEKGLATSMELTKVRSQQKITIAAIITAIGISWYLYDKNTTETEKLSQKVENLAAILEYRTQSPILEIQQNTPPKK